MMMVLMVYIQLFLVDLVDIGLMSASEAVNRTRLEEAIKRLAEAISSGLEVDAGDGSTDLEVTEMRQCTSGAMDINADCSDGALIASSTPTEEEQSWWSQNSNTVIIAAAALVAFYIFIV